MLSILTISSFVNCNKRLPSTLFLLNVSQCAAQSFTRKNWPTSKRFHVSGDKSVSVVDCVTVDVPGMKHGINFPVVAAEFCLN